MKNYTPKHYTPANYLRDALLPESRDALVKAAKKTIKARLKRDIANVEAIVFTGLSGALVAPLIAYELGLGLIGVRKEEDSTHSDNKVEGPFTQDHGFGYLIVDDLVDTGDTVKRIIKRVEETYPNAVFCGAHLYYEPATLSAIEMNRMVSFSPDTPH